MLAFTRNQRTIDHLKPETKKLVLRILCAFFLAYLGWVLASVFGGLLTAALVVSFHLRTETVVSLAWWFPKLVFVGILVAFHFWAERK
jgi:energy-coupling factor transporter transmembrane protein EcfT